MGAILPIILSFVQSSSGLSVIGSLLSSGLLPKLLDAFTSINNKHMEAQGRGLGKQEAAAEAAKHAQEMLATALQAEQAAIAQHKAHPDSDDAFDPGVFRKED